MDLMLKISVRIVKEYENNSIEVRGLNGFDFFQRRAIPPFGKGRVKIPLDKRGYVVLETLTNFKDDFIVDVYQRRAVLVNYWGKYIDKKDRKKYLVVIDPLKMIDECIVKARSGLIIGME